MNIDSLGPGERKIFIAMTVAVGLTFIALNIGDVKPIRAHLEEVSVAAASRRQSYDGEVSILKQQKAIAEATGAVPPGWSVPQAPKPVPQTQLQQEQLQRPQLPPMPVFERPGFVAQETIKLPVYIASGEQIIIEDGFTYLVQGSSNPEVLSAMILVKAPIKEFSGEYRLVSHKNPSERVEWTQGGGPLPEHVRSFLERHKYNPTNGEFIELYTRGGQVNFKT